MFREVRFEVFRGFILGALLLIAPSSLTVAQTSDLDLDPSSRLALARVAMETFMSGPRELEEELTGLGGIFESAVRGLDRALESEPNSVEKDNRLFERSVLLVEAARTEQTATRGMKGDKQVTLLNPETASLLLGRFDNDAYTSRVTDALPEGLSISNVFQAVHDLYHKYNITYNVTPDNSEVVEELVARGLAVVVDSVSDHILAVSAILPYALLSTLQERFNQNLQEVRKRKIIVRDPAILEERGSYDTKSPFEDIGEEFITRE